MGSRIKVSYIGQNLYMTELVHSIKIQLKPVFWKWVQKRDRSALQSHQKHFWIIYFRAMTKEATKPDQ